MNVAIYILLSWHILPQETPSFAEDLLSNQYHIKWTSCSDLPCKLYDASVAVTAAGDTVYVAAGGAPNNSVLNDVYCYHMNTYRWSTLPQPGHRCGVLHMLNDRLIILGGTDSVTYKYQNKVTTYNSDNNSWCSYYPDMLNKRLKPGVITYHDYVIVMGGESSLNSINNSIEIMNHHELQWKEIFIHLPVPMWAIKPIISRNSVTIVGYTHAGGRTREYYQIAAEDIISSLSKPVSAGAESSLWKKLTPATHYNTAIVPYCDSPVIIGGRDSKGMATSDISVYHSSKNSWMKVDSLPSARNNVAVALLNTNSIMVIGGTSSGVGFEAGKASSLTTVDIGAIVPKHQ